VPYNQALKLTKKELYPWYDAAFHGWQRNKNKHRSQIRKLLSWTSRTKVCN
jgi:hypothetical protein